MCGVANDFAQPCVVVHLFGYVCRREAVDVAGCGGYYRAARLLIVERKGIVAHEVPGKFKAHDMGRAVGRITLIFQCPRFDISEVAAYRAGGNKLVAPFVMAQFAVACAKLTPEVGVDIVDI